MTHQNEPIAIRQFKESNLNLVKFASNNVTQGVSNQLQIQQTSVDMNLGNEVQNQFMRQKTQWMLNQMSINSKMVDSLRSMKLTQNFDVQTDSFSQKDLFQKMENMNMNSYQRTDVTKNTSLHELPNHMTFE